MVGDLDRKKPWGQFRMILCYLQDFFGLSFSDSVPNPFGASFHLLQTFDAVLIIRFSPLVECGACSKPGKNVIAGKFFTDLFGSSIISKIN